MLDQLKEGWRLIAIRGYISVIFGIVCFIRPQMAIITMLAYFAILLLLQGINLIVLAFIVEVSNKLYRLFEGIIFCLCSVLLFLNAFSIIKYIFIAVAAWAIITGIIEVATALKMRKSIPDEWFIIVNGIITIVFGIINAAGTFLGTSLIIIVFGTYALLNGMFILFFAYRIRYINIWD